jgi:abortive infection bacteriophage resistance protein
VIRAGFLLSQGSDVQPYDKPHLTFDKQIDHLVDLGLECRDRSAARHILQDVGYYRLTAYTYPFRRLLREDERRDTQFQFRASEYSPGAQIDHAVRLHRFDQGLRAKVFDGIAQLELYLRVQIAYVLGKRDKFGQVNRTSLNIRACDAKPPARSADRFETMFDYWLHEYDKLISRASTEDFISHVTAKYSGEIPVWIAVETFDFGGLTRLFSLMQKYDQNLIASRFGFTNGLIFHKWLVGIGGMRNHCAHHNRLWNRQLTHPLASLSSDVVGRDIWHLSELSARKKIYPWLAVLGYTLRTYDDTSQWPSTIRTQFRKFPAGTGLSLTADMGFPADWEDLDVWSGSRASRSQRVFD